MLAQRAEETLEFIKALRAQQPSFNAAGRSSRWSPCDYEVALELFNYRFEVLKNQARRCWVAPNPWSQSPVRCCGARTAPNAERVHRLLLSAETRL